MKRSGWFAVTLIAAGLVAAGSAFASDAFRADVDFVSMGTVYPGVSVDFHVRVTNETWEAPEPERIRRFEIHMPSMLYSVLAFDIPSPDPLHPESGGVWSAEYADNGGVGFITWRFLTDAILQGGDIEEGEHLDFTFTAITDEIPSDGFVWMVESDSLATAEGLAYFGDADDDDDDTDDDSDDDDGDDDDWYPDDDEDDDDDSGGAPTVDDDDDNQGLVPPPAEDDEDKSTCGN
ncbi:MAG: hypothetical protein KJ042_10255 [Deltaproteobacteria bacterium]|nr:hypothetical protein [Deltaproteobacteria bacterium]